MQNKQETKKKENSHNKSLTNTITMCKTLDKSNGKWNE